MEPDLDNEYGPCLPYQRTASDAELAVHPRSLQILNEETAPYLKSYMETSAGLLLPQVFHATTPILWIIDFHGMLRFAFEEVLDGNTGAVTHILPRNGPPMRPTDVRLGHPALLDPVDPPAIKSARIGGEIFFDPVPQSERQWVISNNSGRFGKRPHIRREHLANANRIFERHGIIFREFFVFTPQRGEPT